MGRDKALLSYRGRALGQSVARLVEQAAGAVTLVGNSQLAEILGFPAIADLHPGEGPLGGILTALDHTRSDWNLVAACDMPELSAAFLGRLLDAAMEAEADALVPCGPSGLPEPLCAVYHRGSRRALEAAFARGERKVMAALAGVRLRMLAVPERTAFQNVNTPEDWAPYAAK